MKIKCLINVYKNCKRVASKSQKSMLFIYKNFKKIKKYNGMWFLHYEFFQLWKYKFEDQKKFLSQPNLFKLEDLIDIDKETFSRKGKCLIYFSSVVKRKWMLTKDNTKDKIENFIKENNSILLKKVLGYEGNGISKLDYDDIIDNPKILDDLKLDDFVLE